MTVQPDASIWLACVFPHSCHSALICFLIPAYMALSPSCLGLSPPVPRCLCLLSLSLCLDLPPVTLSHRGDRVVCPFKLQTLSLTDREKRGLGPSERGNTQGPPRLTSTNWLATPTRLILLRFSHQCPLPLPHNVKERIRALAKIVGNYQTQKRTCAQFFWCVLRLFVLSKRLCFCLPDNLLGVVTHRYDPIIYLPTPHTHLHSHSVLKCII